MEVKKNLIDLKTFTNQGEKIDLVKQKNLNNKDVNRIKNLKIPSILYIKNGLKITRI